MASSSSSSPSPSSFASSSSSASSSSASSSAAASSSSGSAVGSGAAGQQDPATTVWDVYEPSAARFYLGSFLADRKTKVTKETRQLARRFQQMVLKAGEPAAGGFVDVDTFAEVCTKFQLSIDASWLQAKSEAQKKQFVILSNKIDRALRAVKPSNDLRFQLAQAFSDAGHVKDAAQKISQVLSSVHCGTNDGPVQSLEHITTLTQTCCRNGKFNQSHVFVLDAAASVSGKTKEHSAVVACSRALSHFYCGRYEAAALGFANLRFADMALIECRRLVTQREVAVLGALSAIAHLPRNQIQATFLSSFSAFLDILPCLRDAVNTFLCGAYRSTFEAIAKLGDFPKQSPHLSRKIASLNNMIRDRIFLDFFDSYTAIALADVASKLGVTVDTAFNTACALIKAKKMPARVDAVRMVVERFAVDEQTARLEETLDSGLKYHETLHLLAIQSSLKQHEQRVAREQ